MYYANHEELYSDSILFAFYLCIRRQKIVDGPPTLQCNLSKVKRGWIPSTLSDLCKTHAELSHYFLQKGQTAIALKCCHMFTSLKWNQSFEATSNMSDAWTRQ